MRDFFIAISYAILWENDTVVLVGIGVWNGRMVVCVDGLDYFICNECITTLCKVNTIERECSAGYEICVVVEAIVFYA